MLDLTDSNIQVAYQSIIRNEPLNWLLLRYVESSDVLRLFARGTQGLSEMREQIEALEDVFFGFCREEYNGKPHFVLFTYIPEWISSARRSRVLGHTGRVALVLEAQEVTLNISRAKNLTVELVHQALATPKPLPQVPAKPPARSTSMSPGLDKALPSNPQEQQVRRAASESTNPTASPTRSGILSGLLRRKKNSSGTAAPVPDTPPKDKSAFSDAAVNKDPPAPISTSPLYEHFNPDDLPANGYGGATTRLSDDIVVISPGHQPSSPPRAPGSGKPLRRPSQWASDSYQQLSPAEKSRMRREAQAKREWEEQEAIREERERQARIKAEKARILEEEEQERAMRKAALDEELKRATAERLKREQAEKEAEERRLRQLQEKRQADKERRLEESRKLEAWRHEQVVQAEEAARRKEEMRKQAEQDRMSRIKQVGAQVKSALHAEEIMVGWVSVQNPGTVQWRRRYFKFKGSTMVLYRSPQDLSHVLERLELSGRLTGIKEANEGYEDLEAIPQSFAVEFKDSGPWSMFTDTEEEKILLLGFIHQAAHL